MPLKNKIITKTGDRGTSRLFSGEEIPKSSLRMEAYGHLDELNSLLGVARHEVASRRIKKEIEQLQKDLFVVGAEMATTEGALKKLKRRADAAFLADLERRCDAVYADVEIPNDFILPGGTPSSAYLDYARTVARRCERHAVRLFEEKEITNQTILVWLNRLSDYLYLMARFVEQHPA